VFGRRLHIKSTEGEICFDFMGHGASVLAIKSLAFWSTHILSQLKEVIYFVFIFLKRNFVPIDDIDLIILNVDFLTTYFVL